MFSAAQLFEILTTLFQPEKKGKIDSSFNSVVNKNVFLTTSPAWF